jgi:hypothetical protein
MIPKSCKVADVHGMLLTLDEAEKESTSHEHHEVGPFSVFSVGPASPGSGRKASRHIDGVADDIAAEASLHTVNDDCSVPVTINEEVCLNMGPEVSDNEIEEDIEVVAQVSNCLFDHPTSSTLVQVELTTNLFSDKVTRELMYNYVNIVADLLQPASHFQNPYKSIYVPNALVGSADSLAGVGLLESSHSNIAVFHAILSVSAFHLRGTDALPDRAMYDKLGRLHRCKAFQHLQKALLDELDREDHRAAMSAMMSLVSSDVRHLINFGTLQLTVCIADGWRHDRVLDSPRRM